MTNEEIKDNLKKLFDCKTDFTVIQTGKKSIRINGCYNPTTHEILLHNRNFTTTNELMYTAIHELTHHILTTEKGIKSRKCHSGIFWASFYNLLDKAIELSMYERTRSEETQKLIAQAKAIEQEIIEAEKRLGRIIRQIFESCKTHHERNEDVLEHDLQMTRARVRSLVNKSLSDNNNSADIAQSIARASNAEQKMTIEEMKAKSYTRYTAFIEKHIVTKEVEVWAKDWDDARAILEHAGNILPNSAFENANLPDIQQLERSAESPYPIAAAQSTVTDCNEDFYKHEE